MSLAIGSFGSSDEQPRFEKSLFLSVAENQARSAS